MLKKALPQVIRVFLISIVAIFSNPASAIELFGQTATHDPSTIVEDNGTYWTFGTGDGNVGMVSRYSTDLLTWQSGPTVFQPGTWPSWINQRVPKFNGNFWAPDLIEMNGRYYLYYSAFSTHEPPTSAIGVAVTDSLNNPNWQDLGMVVSTETEPRTNGQPVNAIDPGVYRDANGDVWMIYGSHYSGLYIVQIDPNTGLRLGSARFAAIGNNGNWNEFEAAQVQYIDGYYYAFVNLGDCCAGKNSNYYILVGRSTSPTGPFLDINGVNLWSYGSTNGDPNAASTVLATDSIYIGPGHFGYLNNYGQHLASIHYYDGRTPDGWPSRLDILEINMVNGWPTFTRDFTLATGSSNSSSSSSSSGSSSSSSSGGATAIEDGRYTIIARHSGKAMEVAGASSADGANLQQWTSNGGTQQQFDVARQDSGIYTIRPAHSGKSLDVYDWNTAPGGNIVQWDYWGGEPQQFNIVEAEDGYHMIISVLSELALDVNSFSESDGANIMQWNVTGDVNQQWSFQPVDNSSTSSTSSSSGSSSTTTSSSSSSSSTSSSGGSGLDCTVSADSWDSGFIANVTVNNSGATVSGWRVSLTFNQSVGISNAWSANVSTSGNTVTATNVSYNGNLSSGQSTGFGFQGTVNGNFQTPICTVN